MIDGLRTMFVVAEDLAGNVNLPDDLVQERLRIFIDTQGPRITSVFITDVPAYDLFNPKGPDANAAGPHAAGQAAEDHVHGPAAARRS